MKLKAKQIRKFDTPVSTDENGMYVDFVVPGAAMLYDILEMRLSEYDKVDDARSAIADDGWAMIPT